ncbi:FliH/SctL family protein [Methylorubrum rhodesianum]|uniref:FliH/SctL family protein n=1 Tax=Methylorubrum rhodesianum TaxID=29427 RepID=A0ABU9ZI16_9HYPH|nr:MULTISPECIES: FliH/SctL family protein [Methylorubrum]MBB5761623.1 flagellar assembly protein FliH [Methylorubrum rhodesianum]MBI1687504.1 flagellar assembly protein FliH [Methylorubrum sp. DB1722]
MSARASRPFLFDTDFGRPRGPSPADAEASARAEAERAAGEAAAYARGLQDGRSEAALQEQARLADALTRVGLAAAGLLNQSDLRDGEREAQALAFAQALARRIAGEALDARPLAAVEEAARSALRHLRGVPHLVLRVNETLVDEAETLMRRLSREHGFEGRLVVLGEPDMAPGDARLEWADGGVVRERARIEAAVESALSPNFASPEA